MYKAAGKSGIDLAQVQRIMEEPTAAAVAYDLHRGMEPRNVLVYTAH